MPEFSDHSRNQLMTCHPSLIKICLVLIKSYDFRVIEGHRGEARQNAAYRTGNSMLRWPNSSHNKNPSEGIDIAPWPELYDASPTEFAFMAGRFMQIADERGVAVRWGGDWDSDNDQDDQSFKDWGHFELVR